MTPPSPNLLTVGHGNHEIGYFLDLLEGAVVTAVADVRSSPFSRRNPQFNDAELTASLRQRGIRYLFMGDQLGGRPEDPDVYDDDGRVNYERVRKTSVFNQGLQRVIGGMEKFTIVLMCAELDPLDCHRGLMITPALMEEGIAPGHLRKDGSIESTEDMEKRLLELTKRDVIVGGLFAGQISDDDRKAELAQAYREMARKRAFVARDAGEPGWSDTNPD